MRKRRNWTPKRKARVIAFAVDHGNGPAIKKFRINYTMLKAWREGSTVPPGGRGKAMLRNATLKERHGWPNSRSANGHAERAAIASLQAWQSQRFPGPAPSAAELHILNALAALRGGK